MNCKICGRAECVTVTCESCGKKMCDECLAMQSAEDIDERGEVCEECF